MNKSLTKHQWNVNLQEAIWVDVEESIALNTFVQWDAAKMANKINFGYLSSHLLEEAMFTAWCDVSNGNENAYLAVCAKILYKFGEKRQRWA